MKRNANKALQFFWTIILIMLPAICFSKGRVIVKNFCNQPVILHASDTIECEPSGIEIEKKREIRLLEVDTNKIGICSPVIDDGQNTYYIEINQQDTPRELTPETASLPEEGELTWYCSNNGSTGPCECKVNQLTD